MNLPNNRHDDRPIDEVAGAVPDEKPKRKRVPLAAIVAGDILLVGVAFFVFALFHFLLPQAYAEDQSSHTVFTVDVSATAPATEAEAIALSGTAVTTAAAMPAAVSTVAPAATLTQAPVATSTAAPAAATTALGGDKFADKFTDGEVIRTDSSYVSEDISVTLTKQQVDGVTYYLEDVYLRNIENLRTAFAQDTYGKAITDWVLNMAQQNDAIASINGDYYGTGSIGVVIRNGKLYSERVDGDVLALFYDGTMRVYMATEFDAQQVMAAGAYQAWNFGPSLLTEDGEAITAFRGGISGLNPRTAIGYYEPGHYVFVVVDGRQSGYSDGMTLMQLAALFESLGVRLAYNLDGGKTSQMTFGDALVNQPTQGGRATSDIIYIGE